MRHVQPIPLLWGQGKGGRRYTSYRSSPAPLPRQYGHKVSWAKRWGQKDGKNWQKVLQPGDSNQQYGNNGSQPQPLLLQK